MADDVHILVVEDDARLRERLARYLAQEGFRVTAAGDAEEARARLGIVSPDLMVLDVMMATDTEGFEVARKIPDSPELKDMVVLLVTGVTQALHLPNGLKPDDTWLPVDRVLEKPIAPDRLIHEVERLLKEKHRPRP